MSIPRMAMGPDGRNRYIPYQEDRPNMARRLTLWPVHEHAGTAYLWHDLTGGAPAWQVPDIFTDTADHTAALTYYNPSPEAQIIVKKVAARHTRASAKLETRSVPASYFRSAAAKKILAERQTRKR